MELLNTNQEEEKAGDGFLSSIDALNTVIFKVGSIAVLLIMVLTNYEIFLRYVLDAPTTWSHEMGAFLCGVAWIFGGGYNLIHGHHVRMDILYNYVSPKWRAIFAIIGFPFMAIFLGVLLYETSIGAWHSVVIRETSPSEWHPPLYPIKIIIAVGIFFVLGQAITCLCRDILKLTKKGAN